MAAIAEFSTLLEAWSGHLRGLSFCPARVVEYRRMFFSRFGLQSKIIIILFVAVVSVATVSTYLAMLLTRQPVEEAIYRKVLSQALATAHEFRDLDLGNAGKLQARLREVQRDFKGVEQCDVRAHDAAHSLVATTDPSGAHLELDATSGIEQYNEFESAGQDQVSIETA